MKKIFRQTELFESSTILLFPNKMTVLVGGCFDLLHPGHLAFLEAAKQKGDFLIVLLESDESIRRLKGNGRPVTTQKKRAEVLANLQATDAVILLNGILGDKEYDELILRLKPAIIATTEGDASQHHKKRQADLTNAKLLPVIKRLPEYSTSKILKKK